MRDDIEWREFLPLLTGLVASDRTRLWRHFHDLQQDNEPQGDDEEL